MTAFWGLARMEVRLQLRSPAFWITLLLVMVYAGPGSSATYFASVRSIAGTMITIAPLGLALTWLSSIRRPTVHRSAELVESTSLPAFVRMAAETIGSLMVVAVLTALVVAADALAQVLLSAGGIQGHPKDLVLYGLLIAPPLLCWFGVTRLVGRFLPPAVAYLAVAALWGVGLMAGLLIPIPSSWTLSYLPLGSSDLVLFGATGSSLVSHRTVLLIIGALSTLLSLLPLRRARRNMAATISTLVAITVIPLLLAVPGIPSALRYTDLPATPSEWVHLAQTDPRWSQYHAERGDAFVATHHAEWSSSLVEAFHQVTTADGSDPGPITVVEAGDFALQDQVALVPNRLFRDLSADDQLKRRVITFWVSETIPDPVKQPSIKKEIADGVRLFVELQYTADCIGYEVAQEEVKTWEQKYDQLRQEQPTTSLSPVPGLSLTEWRGGSGGSEISLQVALRLWREFPSLSLSELRPTASEWVALVYDSPFGASVESVLSQLVDLGMKHKGDATP